MFWRRRYTGSIYFLDSWLAVTFLIYLYKQLNYLMKTEWCLVTKSCLTLCDPMDCSPPGSSVRGISQARILEWVAIPFFRGSSQARDRTCISLHWQVDSLPLSHLGSPSWWWQWSWKLLNSNKNQRLLRVHYVSVSALKYFTSIISFYPHNKRFLFIAILQICKL